MGVAFLAFFWIFFRLVQKARVLLEKIIHHPHGIRAQLYFRPDMHYGIQVPDEHEHNHEHGK